MKNGLRSWGGRWAAVAGLSLFASGAFATPGTGVVDLDGAGGNPAIAYEQLRFYTPTDSSWPTTVGTVATGDLCGGADVCGKPLVFDTLGGATLSVSARIAGDNRGANAVVVQDLQPNYGGLGIATVNRGGAVGGSRSIDDLEVLKLTFSQQVTLVGFHFFSADHGETGGVGSKAWFQVDGGGWESLHLSSYVSNDPARWFTGTTFEFTRKSQDFYLGSLKIMTPVPEPHALALMLASLGVLGAVVRRRRAR